MKIGSLMPSFNLKGVDDQQYDSNDLLGEKGLSVIFSCNHCPYVLAYEDRMIALAKEFQSKGIPFVAINSNDEINYPQDSFENMKKRAELKAFPFPYLRDETQEVANAFEATHTPQIFLFNSNRKLNYQGCIDDNWRQPHKVKSQYLRDALENLIAEKKIETPETPAIGCTIKWK